MAKNVKTEKKAQAPQAAKKVQKPVMFINTFSGQMLMVFIAIAAIVFLPTTIILFVGMIPAIVAILFSLKGDVARGYCVAATNMVGCFVFIMQLWTKGHTFENALFILSDPMTIVIMYGAAGFGYFLDWFLAGMMSSVIQQRAQARLNAIKTRQQALVDQWGPKVTGNVPLDEDGFPVSSD